MVKTQKKTKLTFKDKLTTLSNKSKACFFDNWCLLFAFLVPIALTAICWAFTFNLYDNRLSTLILDSNAQYVYFFEQLQDVLTGKESLFYTFERALGGEFLGNFTYYLASPLSLLVALFPKGMVPEAIATMMLLKSGLSGLTFCIYLKKTHKRNPLAFSMFSVMYALCAYAVAYQSNLMWIDALIWLPLITLGIEALIKKGNFKLYIISLAIAVWSNYYIGYMLCIFTLLYFIFYMCSHTKEERNPDGISKHTLKSIIRYVIYSAVAIMITGVVILCAVYSLQFGKVDGELNPEKFIPNVSSSFLDVLSKMFIGTFGTFRPTSDGGMPHLYAGTFMLLLLPLFFASKKIATRKKIGYGILCAVFLASLTITTLNLVWHGFNEPVWLSYRFSFLFTFIMLIMAYKAFEVIDDSKFKFFAISSGVLIALLFVIQETVDFIRKEDEPFDIGLQTVWITILLLGAYLLLLYFWKIKNAKTSLIAGILCGLVCFEALLGSVLNWKDAYLDAGASTYKNYNNFEKNSSYISDYFEKNDTSLYRVERTFNRKSNDNLYININGVSEFTSTFNKGTKDILKKFGIKTMDQSSLYYYRNMLTDSLLGIKYLVSDELVNDEPREQLEITSSYNKIVHLENDYLIYENPYALSFAYCVKESVNEIPKIKVDLFLNKTGDYEKDDAYWNSYAERYSLKFASCLLGVDYFEKYYEVTKENVEEITDELKKNSLIVSDYSDTNIKGAIYATKEKPIVFTTIPYDKNWRVYIDGEEINTYKCIDAFLAFDIDEGIHAVEFKYVHAEFYKGLAITTVGLSAFVGLCAWDIIRKKTKKSKETIEE